jgi:hypothetical protein
MDKNNATPIEHTGVQSRTDTAHRNGAAQEKCFVCGRVIAASWFCRIPRDGKQVVLCSAFCAYRYFDSLSQANSQNGRP